MVMEFREFSIMDMNAKGYPKFVSYEAFLRIMWKYFINLPFLLFLANPSFPRGVDGIIGIQEWSTRHNSVFDLEDFGFADPLQRVSIPMSFPRSPSELTATIQPWKISLPVKSLGL